MAKVSHDSETLAQGKQVFTAAAFIHQKLEGIEKVFLAKRAATKKFLPDVWELPGGHIDFGESLVLGLKREVQEEFRVAIEVGDPFDVFTYTNDVKGSHSVQVSYFARFIDPLDKIKTDPEDHSAFGWFTESELRNLFTKGSKGLDDQEVVAMLKAFAFLRGDTLKTL